MDRCDLCNEEDMVVWAWVTPNEAATMEEAVEKHLFWCEDETWHVCDLCHQLILTDSKDALLMRAFMSFRGALWLGLDENGVAQKVDHQAIIRRTHDLFWIHKTTHSRAAL